MNSYKLEDDQIQEAKIPEDAEKSDEVVRQYGRLKVKLSFKKNNESLRMVIIKMTNAVCRYI